MTKIAHLILVHNNPVQLGRLISRLSHADADVYVHVDGKSDIGLFNYLSQTPNVYFIQNRVNVYWGSYSIVQATVNCFEEILSKNKKYDLINLLSGNDYPVKNASQVHEFFDQHPGNIFMEFETIDSAWWKSIMTRVTRYHFTDFHFPGSYLASTVVSKLLPKRKLPKELVFVGRSQWLTVTADGAQYVVDYLKQHPHIRRFFRFSWGSDEIAIQTILYNSPFKNKIVNNNYRYIDWSENKASPKTLTMADAETLAKSTCLYARKFDLQTAPEIFDHLDKTF